MDLSHFSLLIYNVKSILTIKQTIFHFFSPSSRYLIALCDIDILVHMATMPRLRQLMFLLSSLLSRNGNCRLQQYNGTAQTLVPLDLWLYFHLIWMADQSSNSSNVHVSSPIVVIRLPFSISKPLCWWFYMEKLSGIFVRIWARGDYFHMSWTSFDQICMTI